MRNPKFETILNDKNSNYKNNKNWSNFQNKALRTLFQFQTFEHLILRFVSDFGIRISDFLFGIILLKHNRTNDYMFIKSLSA